MKVKFNVTGMTCAACSARVEKVTKAVTGVSGAEVNLLAGKMVAEVENEAICDLVCKAVTDAGYGAAVDNGKKKGEPKAPAEDALKEMKTRIIWSGAFLAVLMYFSMWHMMWGFPLPSFFEGNHVAMGLLQLLLAELLGTERDGCEHDVFQNSLIVK
jgi:Cu2+-exporting ATPase